MGIKQGKKEEKIVLAICERCGKPYVYLDDPYRFDITFNRKDCKAERYKEFIFTYNLAHDKRYKGRVFSHRKYPEYKENNYDKDRVLFLPIDYTIWFKFQLI